MSKYQNICYGKGKNEKYLIIDEADKHYYIEDRKHCGNRVFRIVKAADFKSKIKELEAEGFRQSFFIHTPLDEFM